MRFHFQADTGDTLSFWIAPDNPLAISRAHVSTDGTRLATLSATVTDPGIQAQGWHSTGLCGFSVSEAELPGLGGLRRLEIHDADTNVLVYRRIPEESLCAARVVLIGSGIRPELEIQAALYPFFRQSYFGAGKFPEEMLSVILENRAIASCLVAGTIVVPRYEPQFAAGDALTLMVVHDAFEELASRMIWLRERAGLAADAGQSWRLGPLAESARFAGEYEYDNPKHLKRFFRMLPEPAYRLLYNPLTRQLATRVADDPLRPISSIIAVDVLARMGIVGHRDHFEPFVTTVFDRLGIEAALPVPAPVPEETRALAARLRTLRFAREMVNFDDVISDGVRRSVARGWES